MNHINKGKIRTIVFGSTFGQFYLEALKRSSDQFEIVGLFASGSDRSKQCARAYDIPLITDINEVNPEEVDLACIVLRSSVMGGKGTEFALACMNKGIHVIQEHPIHHKDLANCLRVAQQNNIHFLSGNLYIHLPAFKRFAAAAKQLFSTHKIDYIDIAMATQVSFPLVHMMLQVLPNPRPLKVHQVVKHGGPFQVLVGSWGDIPMTIRAHNEVNPDDPDNHMHLLHSISIGCAGGTLSLTDTHGPVVWKTQLHIPHDELLKNISAEHQLTESSTYYLGASATDNYQDILQLQWTEAIGEDLKLMKNFITGEQRPHQRAQLELLCAQQWNELTSAFGPPELKPDAHFKRVDIHSLANAVEESTQ